MRPSFLTFLACCLATLCATSTSRAQPAIDWQSGGPITTGGGYDMPSGALRRSVVDFEVPGSVGAYPLRCMRTLVTRRFGFDTGSITEVSGQDGGGAGGAASDPEVTTYGEVSYQSSFWYFDFAYTLLNDVVLMPNGTYLDFTRGLRFGIKERLLRSPGLTTLVLADGGRVEFVTSDNDQTRVSATRIVDPHGVATNIELNASGRPKRVVDASGRWIEFAYRGGAVERVTSSAGQSVDFTLQDQAGASIPLITGAAYPDGTSASYVFSDKKNPSCALNLPLRMRDVRSTSRMQEISFAWKNEGIKTRDCVLHKELSGTGVEVSRREDVYYEHVPGGFSRRFSYDDVNKPVLLLREYLFAPTIFQNDAGLVMETNHQISRSFDYDARGFLSAVTDPLKRTTSVVSEPVAGKMARITYPDLTGMTFAYTDPANPYYVSEVEDTRHQKTFYAYFPGGKLRRIVYPAGGGEESWDDLTPYAQPRLHVLRNGAREYFEFDATGRETKHWLPTFDERDPRTDPGAGAQLPHEVRTYYPDGSPWEDLLASLTDPRGNTTSYEYARRDGVPVSGRPLPTKVIHADLTFKLISYDAFGNVRTETDEQSHTTRYDYDEYARIKVKTDPLGGRTQYDYQPLIRIPEKGAPTSALVIKEHPDRGPLSWTLTKPSTVTSPEGRVTRHLYDAESRVVLTAEGITDRRFETFEYDYAGNVTRQTDGLNRVTTFEYDARNRLKVKVAPGPLTTSWDYDEAGNILQITHPDQTTESFTYDAMGRKETHTDERKRKTTWTYYDDDTVRSVVDAELRGHGYVYDASGRLKDEYGPAVERMATQLDLHREYDGAGNLALRRDARSVETRYVYDALNREVERSYSSGAASLYTRYYDSGRLMSVADGRTSPANSVVRTYDANGRLTTETQTVRGLRAHTITYGYDRDGQQTSMDAPHTMSTKTSYNSFGQPVFIHDALGELVSYTYWGDGQRKSKSVAYLGREDYSPDEAGRRGRSAGQAPAPSRTYHYDLRSRPDHIVGTGPGGAITEDFGHDVDSQLTSYKRKVGSDEAVDQTYAYDGSGNRLSSSVDGTYQVNGRNQYVSLSGPHADSFEYDAVGNLTERNGWSYTYDAESRLTSAEGDHEVWQLGYDPIGRLSSIERNGELRYAVYDGERPLLWYSSANELVEATVWGPSGDEPIASYVATLGKNGGSLYYYTDQLNNVVQTATEDGEALERYAYDPFGKPHYYDPVTLEERAESAVKPPHLFSGKPWLAPLGLYHSRARAYDPGLGRFLQMDPMRVGAGDLNLYRYVKNAPVTYVDPTGNFAIPLILVVPPAAEVVVSAAGALATVVTAAIVAKGVSKGVEVAADAIQQAGSTTATAAAAQQGAQESTKVVKPATNAEPKVFDPEKQTLVDMAKADKKAGGIEARDMEAYKQLNDGMKNPFPADKVRGPETHPPRTPESPPGPGQEPHGHVGPVGHIPIKGVYP